ncbi:MAG: antibiotic biosynthesis monooxygenase [Chloroflexi bacterium]|nr:antibiotic biosynthesis monooxygenase [Chloroflexota bacterium]
MPIYMTARFRVQPQSVQTCLYAINDFVDYIRANEPATLQYTSVQDFEDSFAFLNFFVFENEAAEEQHRTSPGTLRFIDALYNHIDVDVLFERWNAVATT